MVRNRDTIPTKSAHASDPYKLKESLSSQALENSSKNSVQYRHSDSLSLAHDQIANDKSQTLLLPTETTHADRLQAELQLSLHAEEATKFSVFRESYNDMDELRRELKVISVRMNAPYYMQHSSPQRLEARCITWKTRKQIPTTCEYVVSANRHTNGRVYVTRANIMHEPNCLAIRRHALDTDSSSPGAYMTPHITAAALMETAKPYMKRMLQQQEGNELKPKHMADLMKEQFGVSASYMTAWRALSAFRQQRLKEESASFMKIRGYLEALNKNNERSVIAFEHVPMDSMKDESRLSETLTEPMQVATFMRAYLCPGVMQDAVRYCRSSILLTVLLITSTYGGAILTASAQDALGDFVPLAIGLVPNESEAHWLFFLQNLKKSIAELGSSVNTFVHNRGILLQQVCSHVFPDCAQSSSIETVISHDSSSSFQWLESLCSKSPLMILVGWVSKVASLLFERYDRYAKMETDYPQDFQTLLLQYQAQSDHFEVLRIAENGFEVVDQHSGKQRVVDFAKQSCTCGEYCVSGFPCLHVYLAITYAGLLQADYIPKIFLVSSLQTLYSGRITPIDVDTVPPDNKTVPPKMLKARGRPRKVQQIQQFADSRQEKLACSVCGVKGHNKRTCKRSSKHHKAHSPLQNGSIHVRADEDHSFLTTAASLEYEDDLLHTMDTGALASGTKHVTAENIYGTNAALTKRRRVGNGINASSSIHAGSAGSDHVDADGVADV